MNTFEILNLAMWALLGVTMNQVGVSIRDNPTGFLTIMLIVMAIQITTALKV
jgi:hypothetical protein